MDAVQTARRGSVFERIGGVRHPAKSMVFHRIPVQRSNEICKFWVQGRCNRNPCRFLHSDPQKTSRESMKQDSREVICNKEEQSSDEDEAVFKKEEAIPSKKAQICDSILRKEDDSDGTHKRKCPPEFDDDITQPIPKRKRPNLEATLLKVLEGKKEAVTGLALPCGGDKLYTGTKDGTLSIWDCNSGACVHTVKLGTEITCMMSQGSWFFVATDSGIKACDTSTCTEQPLATDGGNVCSLATDGAASLFGGLRDGSIMVWKGAPHKPWLV